MSKSVFIYKGQKVDFDPKRQYTRWIFTWHHYTEDDWKKLKDLVEDSKSWMRYLKMGKELGEQKNTPHIQGYFETKTKQRITALEKKFPWWVNPAKGSAEQNSEYVTKERIESFEGGKTGKKIRQEQGALEKERWLEIQEMMQKGDIDGLRQEYPSETIRYNLEKRVQFPYEKEYSPHCLWIWGPKHTGKSQFAYDFGRCRGGWYEKPFNKWWDGYTGQPCVILSDPNFTKMQSCEQWFFQLVNKMAFHVEVKGGGIFIRPKFVIVTSNISMKKVFFNYSDTQELSCDDKQVFDAIQSRFTVLHFKQPWNLFSDRNPKVTFGEEEQLILKRQACTDPEELRRIDGQIAKRRFVNTMQVADKFILPPDLQGKEIAAQAAPSGVITLPGTVKCPPAGPGDFEPGKDECPPDGEDGESEKE